MHKCEVKFMSEEIAYDSQDHIQKIHSKADSLTQTDKFLVIIYC